MPKVAKWYEFKNLTATSADLYILGDITADYWETWQPEDQYPEKIRNFLAGVAGKDLDIYINSGGGSVFGGLAIYQMIKRHAEKNRVKVHVDGLAGSIASVIAFAGSEPPEIPANGFLMIHNPAATIAGNAEELRKMADALDTVKTGLLAAYMENTVEGVTEKQVSDLMDAETWLTGTEAAKYFQVETSAAREYVAAVGDNISTYKHIPRDLTREKTPAPEDVAARVEIRQMMISACTTI